MIQKISTCAMTSIVLINEWVYCIGIAARLNLNWIEISLYLIAMTRVYFITLYPGLSFILIWVSFWVLALHKISILGDLVLETVSGNEVAILLPHYYYYINVVLVLQINKLPFSSLVKLWHKHQDADLAFCALGWHWFWWCSFFLCSIVIYRSSPNTFRSYLHWRKYRNNRQLNNKNQWQQQQRKRLNPLSVQAHAQLKTIIMCKS